MKTFAENIWKNRILLLFILPGFLLIVLFNYMPMFGLVLAFKNFSFAKGIFGSDWNGLDNFRLLFLSASTTWRILRNTVGYFVLFTGVGTLCNVALAIALNECRKRYFARFSQTIMILPTFISFVAVTFIVKGLLVEHGLVNDLIVLFGGQTVSFYSEPKYWPYILLGVNLWKSTGYGSILYLSALAGMDPEMFEAAKLDGAGKWQQIRFITIPLLSSMVAIITILSLGGIMTSNTGLFYQVPLNIGTLYPATQTLDAYVLNAMVSGSSNFGATTAVTFFQSFVGCLMVVCVNLVVRRTSPEHSLF
jgi:putative aldouronate transport system permease protein